MHPQSTVSYLGWFQSFFRANHLGSVLALSFSLFLAACGGGGNTVTENDLSDPVSDGIAPEMVYVEIKQSAEKFASANGVAKLGQNVQVNFEASEALMKPIVMINEVAATVSGSVTNWSAIREMTESDVDGIVTFKISFTDISGIDGEDVTAPVGNAYTEEDENGNEIEVSYVSQVEYCAEGCVAPVADPLIGEWKLDGEGAAGVGPEPLDKQWWSSTSANGAGPNERPCWFDDSYVFSGSGDTGTFLNKMDGKTLVGYQDGPEDICAAPESPHDGSANAMFDYAEGGGTIDGAVGALTLTGKGAFIGLAKVINGAQITSASAAADAITYQVMSLSADGQYMTVTIDAGGGVWWTFDLVKVPPSPLEGAWQLDGEGAAGVGPNL